MSWTQDHARTLEQYAERVAATGAPLPEKYLRARAALDAMGTDPAAARARLLEAIEEGRAEDVPSLALAAALAAADLVQPLRQTMGNDLVGALRRAWATDAEATYLHVAERFDAAAERLAEACALVDPETDPASLVGRDSKQQSAWLAAAEASAELENMLPALAAAAELAGHRFPQTDGPDARRRDPELMLTCIPGRAHRRRVWEAWDHKGGRTGRWGALAALGVTIRAARAGESRGYNRPGPVLIKSEPHSSGGFSGHRQYEWDPADHEWDNAPAETTEPVRAPKRVQG